MTIGKPQNSQWMQLRSLWQEAFADTDAFLDDFAETAFSTDRCRIASVDGRIAAALYWFDCWYLGNRVAYLYAVATAKAYRGQGICHRLMEDTHRHLKQLGYVGVILVPGSESLFKFYERMGYQKCSDIREIHCTASDTAVSVEQINKAEYAKLRRQLLPENAVLQEGENLDFLETQEAFYRGEDFVLAAHGEGSTLLSVELLGNEKAASGILNALGFAKGMFRTYGGDKPFAMCFSFGESTLPPPAYFGLAFDL